MMEEEDSHGDDSTEKESSKCCSTASGRFSSRFPWFGNSFRGAKLFVKKFFSALRDAMRFKILIVTVVSYVFLSALCNVIQMRIYKQLLIYAYVHEILIATALQCAVIIPFLFLRWCWVKCRYVYENNIRKRTYETDGIEKEWSKSSVEINVRGASGGDCFRCDDEDEYEDDSRKVPVERIFADRCTATETRFYLFTSFFSFVAGGFRVLPIMILPSMLMVFMDQFGLIFMMAISATYLGRKYDKVQLLCVVLIALGLIIEIIPDYEESMGFAKDISHDFFWRNTIYHDHNASINHFYRLDRDFTKEGDDGGGGGVEYGKNTLLFRERFVNASVFDLSRCLKTQNVSLNVDEEYSYSFYKKALENESLKWWRENNVAFLICIFLAIASSFPECLSYAIMEKFWKVRAYARACVKSHAESRSQRGFVISDGDVEGKIDENYYLSGLGGFEMASKIVAFKLIWVAMLWPFFYLPNLNLGGYHYLKYGSQCSFDALYYDVRGVLSHNDSAVPAGIDSKYNDTSIAKITSVWLEGDHTNENVKYPVSGTNGNIAFAYWECSPWRNGISCENMMYLTAIYCVLDFAQYVLHVKIIRDTTNANLAWLLGIIRIGISDAMFSIPIIAGGVFSSFRYFDILSLMIITCATLIFWLHKYQRDDDDEDDFLNADLMHLYDDDEEDKKVTRMRGRNKDHYEGTSPDASFHTGMSTDDVNVTLDDGHFKSRRKKTTAYRKNNTSVVFTDEENDLM